MGRSAGARLACAEKEAFDFLWCLELWSGAKASLQYGCPGFVQKCLMSQFEKGFVLSVSSFTQPWGKTKQNAKIPQHWGAQDSRTDPHPLQLLLCGQTWVHPREHSCTSCACHVSTAVSRSFPQDGSVHLSYQKFQIFKAVSVFSVYRLGFYNASSPKLVQHLPHTDIGPFPVLGISVLCWSNSDSNFKMFRAAISWQDSTSFPMPWLIRGGWEEQFIRDTNSFLLFLGKSLYSTWKPWTLER